MSYNLTTQNMTTTALSAVLNGNNDVVLTGTVTVTDSGIATVSNANLVMTGEGSIVIPSGGRVLFNALRTLSGVNFSGPGYFDSHLIGNGFTIQNCNLGIGKIWITGGNSLIENNTITSFYQDQQGVIAFYGNSPNSIIRYNTINNTSGFESIVYDCLDAATNSGVAAISAKTAETITLSDCIGSITSANFTGLYVMVASGNGRGRYFRITGQVGNVLTVDTAKYPLDSAITTGDLVLYGPAFADNQIYGNTCNLTGSSGVVLFGSCYGNQVSGNTINGPESGNGSGDFGWISDYRYDTEGMEAKRVFYALNAANNWYDNHIPAGIFIATGIFSANPDGSENTNFTFSQLPYQLTSCASRFDNNGLVSASAITSYWDLTYREAVSPSIGDETGRAGVTFLSGSPSLISSGVLQFVQQPTIQSSMASGGVIAYGTGEAMAEVAEADATTAATVADIQTMLEQVQAAGLALATVADVLQLAGQISESLLAAATALTSVSDRQAMVETITAVATSGASLANIAAYLEKVTAAANGSASVMDAVTSSEIGVYPGRIIISGRYPQAVISGAYPYVHFSW